jgi:hypothetical protein
LDGFILGIRFGWCSCWGYIDAALQYPTLRIRKVHPLASSHNLHITINVGSRAWRMGVRLQSTQDSDITLPSQSRLSPGNYICMCYLASSVGLAQIAGHIFQTFYSVPQQRGILGPQTPGIHRISRRTIAHLNSELIRRRHDVPPHLRITLPLSSARSPSLTSASDIPSPQ